MISIYKLVCPITYDVRYVGKTKQPLNIRLNGHLSACSTKIMFNWISSLAKNNLIPIISEIESVDEKIADKKEYYWINKYTEYGHDLLNKRGNPQRWR